MFGSRRSKKKAFSAPPAASGDDDLGAFRDADPPTFEAFQVREVHEADDGPYYIAPDSAKPLPSGLWANLDPESVEKAASRIGESNNGKGFQPGQISPEVRRALAREGALGRQVTRLLESGSAESADPFSEI
jgi:hypothetical protein